MARRRREALSPVDTAWLRMEDRDNLMMITGVMMFDQPLDYGRVRAVLEQRLLRWDRFRSKIVEPKFGVGGMYWEVDPKFNIDDHLRRFKLPGIEFFHINAKGGRADCLPDRKCLNRFLQ